MFGSGYLLVVVKRQRWKPCGGSVPFGGCVPVGGEPFGGSVPFGGSEPYGGSEPFGGSVYLIFCILESDVVNFQITVFPD